MLKFLTSRSFDIPFNKDFSWHLLPWMLGLLILLTLLALISAVELESVIKRTPEWSPQELRITLPAPLAEEIQSGPESGEYPPEIFELLEELPNITRAYIVSKAALPPIAQASMPASTWIEAEVSQHTPLEEATLSARLNQHLPGVSVQSSQRPSKVIVAFAKTARAMCLLIALLTTLAAILCIVHVTRMGVEVHREAIKIFQTIGAHDSYIARQFQNYAIRLALKGSLLGITSAGILLQGGQILLNQRFHIQVELAMPEILAILFLTPLFLMAFSSLLARLIVKKALGHTSLSL